MSATLTAYSTSSPRPCAMAEGATKTLRRARHEINARMTLLLEQQTGGNHRRQHHAGDEQPGTRAAHVQGVAQADTCLDPRYPTELEREPLIDSRLDPPA